jgi:hypothetical protein
MGINRSVVCPMQADIKDKVVFVETFDEDWEGRWIPSNLDDYKGKDKTFLSVHSRLILGFHILSC